MNSETDKNDQEYLKTKFKEHFQHMCNAGYDPLVCVNRNIRYVNNPGRPNQNISLRDQTQYMDVIINEERYVDLLTLGKIKETNLDDIIILPPDLVTIKMGAVIDVSAALFWLYPSGCKTLGDLFKKYEKKIKHQLKNQIHY